MVAKNSIKTNLELLYITSQAFPATKASGVQVMQMCGAFASIGAKVKLVALEPDKNILSETDLQQYYDVLPNFEIKQLNRSNAPRPVDMFQLQAILKEREESILCYTRGRDVTAPILGLMLGMYAVVEVHGKPASLKERLMLRLIQSHSKGMIVSISRNLRDLYINQMGFTRNRLVAAPGGVDTTRFNPNISPDDARKQLDMDHGTWLVYAGGLYNGRGLGVLFESAAKLPVKVMIVGGNNIGEIHKWKHKARALGAHNVYFAGYQPPEKVPLYLAASDILIMNYEKHVYTPSGEDTSSFASPTKMFEYMAASRPIIASDTPMVRELLTNEYNALLVSPGSAASLNTAIRRLINNPELGQHIATTARTDVEAHSWIDRAQHIINQVGIK